MGRRYGPPIACSDSLGVSDGIRPRDRRPDVRQAFDFTLLAAG
jgi:hypothetical protein